MGEGEQTEKMTGGRKYQQINVDWQQALLQGGVSAQRGHSAQQPVTTLQTTHHRGSYGHRVTTADVDSNLTFWELYSALTHCLSLWAE
mmetsp:Transcript_39931/g.66409  ORF Transcript_39931/g.66409 Transcript_39931/m.66409 type:complete len:88 (+) Transcript_39931:599-862(+)